MKPSICRQLNPPNSQMIRMIGSGMPISHKSNPRPIVSLLLKGPSVAITPMGAVGSNTGDLRHVSALLNLTRRVGWFKLWEGSATRLL
jgi:hypothetical protein